MKLTQEELKRQLHYDPETGIFIRKVSNTNANKIGDEAGGVDYSIGYLKISINNRPYYAHRLAFLYMEGYMPENCVDHIDRNPLNNKWENLRESSQQCNTRNSGVRTDNTSGVRGIYWATRDNRWVARINESGKSICLGYFKTKLDAAKARWEAEKKYEWPTCNTTSSAYLYLKEKGEI